MEFCYTLCSRFPRSSYNKHFISINNINLSVFVFVLFLLYNLDQRWNKKNLLGAFAKFRKATISHYVCPSLLIQQLGFHRTDIHKFDISVFFFRKSIEKIQIFLKIRQEWWVLYVKTFVHLWYQAEFFRCEMLHTNFKEKSNRYFVFNNFIFFK
jgi:hypothetical protein